MPVITTQASTTSTASWPLGRRASSGPPPFSSGKGRPRPTKLNEEHVIPAPVFYDPTTTIRPLTGGFIERKESKAASSMICSLMNHRGISWPSTPAGSTAVQPCIAGSASWRCTGRGQWAPSPDLSLCQGKNWSSFEVRDLENLDSNGTINLYGGDIVALLERVASLTDQFPSETNTRYSPINCFR